MARSIKWTFVVLSLVAWTVPAQGNAVFKSTATGDPGIKSIDVISFGPQGLLLIGDGKGGQIIAVDTGDTTAKPWTVDAIDKIDEKLAGRLGTTAKGIELKHLAVNPASGTAYVALLKQDDKKPLLMTVDGSGKIGEFALDNVKHVRVPLQTAKGPVLKITDIAFADDRVLAAAQSNEEFASKVFSIPVPLDPKAKTSSFSTETYHVSHRRWETKAPLSTLMPFEENGKKYVVGAFACTPVVKYPLDDIKPDAPVKGTSVVELGNGNRPLNMFIYEKDGKSYVLMNTFRMFHQRKPFGPSPYLTMRLDLSLLRENDKINEKAVLRLDGKDEPATDKIQLVEAYHGVVHLDKLDKDRALVMRQDPKNGEMTLTALALP